jgi:SecD/SecF fusion protein
MWEKTLKQRFALIGVVLLIGVWLIYPPQDKLRGGLDIEGGVSLIFEIEEEEGEDNRSVAEQMKRLLQKRVDPKGVYDLKWRVIGSNRLEVQMPLPPEENKELKRAFIEAREALLAANIKRGELERALRLSGPERGTELVAMAGGSADREKLLREAAECYDAYAQALQAYQEVQPDAEEGSPAGAESEGSSLSAESRPPTPAPQPEPPSPPAELDEAAGDTDAGAEEEAPGADVDEAAKQPPVAVATTQPATRPAERDLKLWLRDASEALDDGIAAVLDTNFDDQRFQEILEMESGSPRRKSSIKDLVESYPNLKDKIGLVIERYAAWRAKRAFLEGPADLRRLLRGAGVLEFRLLAEPAPENPTKYDRYREALQERGPRPAELDTEQWFPVDNPLAFFNLDSPVELREFDPAMATRFVADKRDDTWYVLAKRGPEHSMLHTRGGGRKWRLKSAYVTRDRAGRRAVGFNLDPIGGSIFARLTGDNVGRQLSIFVDDVAYSSAEIQSRISTSGIITGDFSREKINYLIQTLQAGSLPARLKDTPLSERTTGSSLGHTNLDMAFRAGVAGVITVAALMMIYYMVSGMIANVALMMNIILVLAAMAMLGARFTLPGIAGVILTIGMTVDANVLIFERMREEKARGGSLRMVIKNGYEKAFSTIIDANITTLLICVIIYYVGSEEIKGFGLTLGWGIVCSLFTALFVTRTVFTLLVKYNLLKDIKMLQLIGVPTINWYAKRKFFIPVSLILMAVGLGLLYTRGWDAFDVEFRGGVNAEIALKENVAADYNDVRIGERLNEVGRQIADDGRRLAEAVVQPVPGDPTAFRVELPGVPAERLAAMIAEPLEDGESGALLQRAGVEASVGQNNVLVRVKEEITAEQLGEAIHKLADNVGDSIPLSGGNIARANVGLVTETGSAEERGRFWNVTTTETNKALVEYALVSAFGDDLEIQPRISYVVRGLSRPDGLQPYPITNRRLEAVIPGLPPGAGGDVTDYLGGAALYFDELSPPQPLETVKERLRAMRLQPDYENLPWRDFDVFGVKQAGVADDGEPVYGGIVITVVDQKLIYDDDRDLWLQELAIPELGLAKATFDKAQTLRKVTQFKPQIAGQSQQRALIALVLSWAMIIAYLWIRFGQPRYGLSGVAALVHDIFIALAFVGISGWIGGVNHPIGNALLISDFKIDMTIVAAFLTLIGYSINDTIVVFDRIRETRGRLGVVTPQIINQSINQCLSRTVLTSVTTFIVLLVMYMFGGSSIRGFNYCMMIGVITGTYSSIAVASPLLMLGVGQRRVHPRAAVVAASR